MDSSLSSRATIVDTKPVPRHLSGRRRHGRRFVQHEVECSSARRTLQGRVLNLSCSGALVRLCDPQLATETESELFTVASRLAFMFSEGLTLSFVKARVLARARIVRVARERGQGLTVVGLDFARGLTFNECHKLGIPHESARATGA